MKAKKIFKKALFTFLRTLLLTLNLTSLVIAGTNTKDPSPSSSLTKRETDSTISTSTSNPDMLNQLFESEYLRSPKAQPLGNQPSSPCRHEMREELLPTPSHSIQFLAQVFLPPEDGTNPLIDLYLLYRKPQGPWVVAQKKKGGQLERDPQGGPPIIIDGMGETWAKFFYLYYVSGNQKKQNLFYFPALKTLNLRIRLWNQMIKDSIFFNLFWSELKNHSQASQYLPSLDEENKELYQEILRYPQSFYPGEKTQENKRPLSDFLRLFLGNDSESPIQISWPYGTGKNKNGQIKGRQVLHDVFYHFQGMFIAGDYLKAMFAQSLIVARFQDFTFEKFSQDQSASGKEKKKAFTKHFNANILLPYIQAFDQIHGNLSIVMTHLRWYFSNDPFFWAKNNSHHMAAFIESLKKTAGISLLIGFHSPDFRSNFFNTKVLVQLYQNLPKKILKKEMKELVDQFLLKHRNLFQGRQAVFLRKKSQDKKESQSITDNHFRTIAYQLGLHYYLNNYFADFLTHSFPYFHLKKKKDVGP